MRVEGAGWANDGSGQQPLDKQEQSRKAEASQDPSEIPHRAVG